MSFRQRFQDEYALCQWAVLDLRREYKESGEYPLLFINFIFGPMIALGMAIWFTLRKSDV